MTPEPTNPELRVKIASGRGWTDLTISEISGDLLGTFGIIGWQEPPNYPEQTDEALKLCAGEAWTGGLTRGGRGFYEHTNQH